MMAVIWVGFDVTGAYKVTRQIITYNWLLLLTLEIQGTYAHRPQQVLYYVYVVDVFTIYIYLVSLTHCRKQSGFSIRRQRLSFRIIFSQLRIFLSRRRNAWAMMLVWGFKNSLWKDPGMYSEFLMARVIKRYSHVKKGGSIPTGILVYVLMGLRSHTNYISCSGVGDILQRLVLITINDPFVSIDPLTDNFSSLVCVHSRIWAMNRQREGLPFLPEFLSSPWTKRWNLSELQVHPRSLPVSRWKRTVCGVIDRI